VDVGNAQSYGASIMARIARVIVLAAGTLTMACSPKAGASGGSGGTSGFPASGGAAGADASLGAGATAGTGGANGTGGDTLITVHDAMPPPLDAPLNADSGCESVKDTRPQAPNVLIVLDRSKSMYLGSVNRWQPAVTAITNLTASLDSQIRFGLLEFPAPSVTGLAGQCATGELIVPPELHSAATIASALAGDPTTKVGGGTPTAATLGIAKQALASLPGTSYVLLVTDGAPNCDAALDPQTCTCTGSNANDCTGAAMDGGPPSHAPFPTACLDDDATVAAVADLAAAGVHTFVIGYDTAQFGPTLDRMAAAGGTARTTYYPVSDGTALSQAFQSISSYVASCSFQLSEAPPSASYVSVTVDGHRIKNGTGWKLVGDRVVELVDAACATVSDGQSHDVLVVRTCEPGLF
jgi:hypothetical protein